MVKHCFWGTCNSDSRYSEREHMSGVTWIPFPKPFSQADKCQRWVKLCGRKNFTVANVNTSTYICSKHFVSGRPTEEYPDPLPATGTPFDVEKAYRKKRRVLSRVETNNGNGPQEKKIKNELFCWDVGALEEMSSEVEGIQSSAESDCDVLQIHNEDVEVLPVIEGKDDIPKVDHSYCSKANTTAVSTTSIQCQTDVTLEDLSAYDDIHLKDKGSMRRSHVMNDVRKDDASCKFYTGLSLGIFFLLLNSLKDKAAKLSYWRGKETNLENNETKRRGPKRQLFIREEMVMTLMRLRRGIDTKTLGAIFGVQAGTVSKNFFTWTTFLSLELKFLISWPTRNQIAQKLPSCFKYFPNTRCVIDCTEFFYSKTQSTFLTKNYLVIL